MSPRRLFVVLALLTAGTAFATEQTPPANPAPATGKPRELALVVVETLEESRGAITAFDYLDLAFQALARQRHWPLTLVAERYSASTADHAIELRIFNRGISQDIPDELSLRAWVILTVDGRKHDFGIIRFRYYPRFGERSEVTLEKIYAGFAAAAAAKIEPILFPAAKS